MKFNIPKAWAEARIQLDEGLIEAGVPLPDLSRSNLIRYSTQLARLCLNCLGEEGTIETWEGRFGQVIVDGSGEAWAGDLCYMRERFGWTSEDYMAAYGATPEGTYLTDELAIHQAPDGKFVLVVPLGGDGAGPFGTGIDTGSISFVALDRSRLEAGRAACLKFLLGVTATDDQPDPEDIDPEDP